MRPPRPCLGLPGVFCNQPTRNPGGRCDLHAPLFERGRHNRAYDTAEYRRARNAAVDAWIAEHGNWCPGYLVAAHPSNDLTADHPDALANGGALVQAFTVMCRGCNTRKGARQAVPA